MWESPFPLDPESSSEPPPPLSEPGPRELLMEPCIDAAREAEMGRSIVGMRIARARGSM